MPSKPFGSWKRTAFMDVSSHFMRCRAPYPDDERRTVESTAPREKLACVDAMRAGTDPSYARVGEVLVDEADADRALSRRRRDALDRTLAHVADGEDAAHARLEQ